MKIVSIGDACHSSDCTRRGLWHSPRRGRRGLAFAVCFVAIALLVADIPPVDGRVPFTNTQPDVPRIAMHDLSKPGMDKYRKIQAPFILTHAMLGWSSVFKWDQNYLADLLPDAIVDYYPSNLLMIAKKPFLVPTTRALHGIAQGQADGVPQYGQWRLTLPAYQTLADDVRPTPPMLDSARWLAECLPKQNDRDNFVRANAWHMMLFGNEGAGMFLHQDGLATITWQAQISGRKEWVLCDPAPEFSDNIPAAGTDAFHPDLEKYPQFVNASCTSVVVEEGEILVYPPHWWHQTLNLDFPAIGLAGRLVNKGNADEVLAELLGKCNRNDPDISLQYPGASPNMNEAVCAAIPRCHDLWMKGV